MVGVRKCRLLCPRYVRGKRCSMKRRILVLVAMALLTLAIFAPATIAQDDDDDGAATATATATATPTSSPTSTATAHADGDDGRAASAAGSALPRTGGPDLLTPIAGALLIGGGVVGGIALSCHRDGS
jgi:hypothetical protein